MHDTLEAWEAAGVDFRSVAEGFDTSTAIGRLLLNLLASLAEFELEVLRDRVHAGMQRARRQGKRIGRPPVMERPELQRLWPSIEIGLRSGEISLREAANILHIGKSTVYRLLGEARKESAEIDDTGRHQPRHDVNCTPEIAKR